MWPEFKLFSLVFLLVISCYILQFALRAEEPHKQCWCWACWDCSAWRPPEAPWDCYSWTCRISMGSGSKMVSPLICSKYLNAVQWGEELYLGRYNQFIEWQHNDTEKQRIGWTRFVTVVQAAEHPEGKGATNGEDASSLSHQPRARLGLGPHHLPFWPSEGLPECHRFPWFLWWEDSAGLVVLIISLRSPSSYSCFLTEVLKCWVFLTAKESQGNQHKLFNSKCIHPFSAHIYARVKQGMDPHLLHW